MEEDLPEYVWVAYSNNPARTVEAVFDTAIELATYLGIDVHTVYRLVSRVNTGKIKDSHIRKIRIGGV